MPSPDIDSESLQAVKNLKSKFEQLASGTSAPSGLSHLSAAISAPRRSSSNSQLNDDSVSDPGHLRSSSSSHALVKRAPPPPPNKSPGLRRLSPQPVTSPISSPSLVSVTISPSRTETRDVDMPPTVSALRSKFASPVSPSHQRRNIELAPNYSPPAIPPRPSLPLAIQRSMSPEELPEDHLKPISKSPVPPPVPVRRSAFRRAESSSNTSASTCSSEEADDFQVSRSFSPQPPPPPIPARRISYSYESDSTSSLLIRSRQIGEFIRPAIRRPSVSPVRNHPVGAKKTDPPPPLPARPQSLLIESSVSSSAPSPSDGDRKPLGSSKLPPPPMRTIGLGDKLPPARRPSSPSSEDESGDEEEQKSQGVDMMPDSSFSSRCPPVLRFRQTNTEPRIHVHPHGGCVAVSGSYVAVGYHHHIKIYNLAVADTPFVNLSTKEAKDPKVTCMEFRPTQDVRNRGFLLWVGTKEGTIIEVDVRTGLITATKYAAHIHSITHIFRHGHSMITLDESGKVLIFFPFDDSSDLALATSPSRVSRTTEKQDFVKLIDGKLWTASRTERHGNGTTQRLPMIRVFDIFNPGGTGKSVLPCEYAGSVTSATILPSQPETVYVGHEEGYISLWTLDTDDGYPQCIEVMKVGMSDVLCLEGVNDRLWAGGRNGTISAYDVSYRPWILTNCWNAHPGLPVLKLIMNHYGIDLTGQLCVASIGRDEYVRLWDGLLGLDWVDKELGKLESSFSTFNELQILVVSWNCDSARPDSLSGDPRNSTFLQEVLSVDEPPDVIVFGFQEVIDLENRSMAAKTVILGGNSKKKADDGLSDKVTGAYKRWYEYLVHAVRSCSPPDVGYTVIHTDSLVGLFTCIFVKSELRSGFNDILGNLVKRGMGGRYGNKGAIVARFVVGDSSICFVNCHLAAGQNAVRRRNADIAGILEEKAVFKPSEHPFAYVGGGDGSMVLDHEFVILNGDLNYRIDHRREAIMAFIRTGDIPNLLLHDQLLREMKFNRACRLRFFNESPLTFAPTYKYDRHTDEYDTSEKRRSPAWCDRVLWRTKAATSRVRPLHYRRYEVNVSDHRPISAGFAVTIKQFDREAREKAKVSLMEQWVDEQERLLVACQTFYSNQALL